MGTVVRHGDIRISELAEVESLNPTMLSRSIGRLEELGYVTREADENDRRAAHVVATQHGRKLVLRLRTRKTALLVERIDRLSPAQRSQLDAALPILEALTDERALV